MRKELALMVERVVAEKVMQRVRGARHKQLLRGFAGAQCGKAPPYRRQFLIIGEATPPIHYGSMRHFRIA
jgi:hypothetical protein